MSITIISLLKGFFGISFILLLAYLFSENKQKINWKIVVIGLLAQILLAFLILNPFFLFFLDYFRKVFDLMGRGFVYILDFSKDGTRFLFNSFLDTEKFGFIFAFQVL